MRRILVLAILFALASPANARTIEGVELAETVTTRDGAILQLHGAGVRSKFVFDIYVGALYLPATGQGAETILGADQPARIEMHFVYDEVEAEKLQAGWREGFEDNNERAMLRRIKPQLDEFVNAFPTAREADVFTMEYLPGEGTLVRFNDEAIAAIEGEDFFNALLRVFLGPKPPDKDLKRGMLGE